MELSFNKHFLKNYVVIVSPDTKNRKRNLSEPSVEDDTPTSSPWRQRVKRVKEERLKSGGRGRLKRCCINT